MNKFCPIHDCFKKEGHSLVVQQMFCMQSIPGLSGAPTATASNC